MRQKVNGKAAKNENIALRKIQYARGIVNNVKAHRDDGEQGSDRHATNYNNPKFIEHSPSHNSPCLTLKRGVLISGAL